MSLRARVLLLMTLPVAVAAAVLVVASSSREAAAAPDAAFVTRGKVLVETLQCSRCHAATGLPVAAASRATSCSGCHAWIAGTRWDPVEFERQHDRFPYWDRYVENVDSFLGVPDFAAASRLDEAWVARYVRDPYEVRPGQYERMLRAPVTAEESRAIAAFLRASRRPLIGVAADAAAIPVSTTPAHLAEGAALVAKLQCGRCHAIGAADPEAFPGAPDLAHTRDRMAPADIAAYIANPDAFGSSPVGGRASMPSFDLSAEEAARIRDYLIWFPVAPELAAGVPPDLPLLTRAVAWEEVRSKVFGQICVHCHMTASKNAGEGGAGNTGGLGFAGKGLDLESWDAMAASTVLAPRAPGEEPPLIARLRIRSAEHTRELAGPHRDEPPAPDAVRGMPLALPALSPADMQLVRSWIAQGAPGPDGRLAVAVAKPAAPRKTARR